MAIEVKPTLGQYSLEELQEEIMFRKAIRRRELLLNQAREALKECEKVIKALQSGDPVEELFYLRFDYEKLNGGPVE